MAIYLENLLGPLPDVNKKLLPQPLRCDYGSKGRAIREGGEIVSSGVKVFVKVVKLFVKVWKLFCESPETFRKLFRGS